MSIYQGNEIPLEPRAVAVIDQITIDILTLFPEGQSRARILGICDAAKSDILSEFEHREGAPLVLAVVGGKNSGKSWLCSRLLKDETNRAHLPIGLLSSQSTSKPCRIGPLVANIRKSSIPVAETELRVNVDGMVDLGRPYNLLDLPPFDAANLTEVGRQMLLNELRGIRYRVVVVSSDSMESESHFKFLSESDGTCILPVVIDSEYPLREKDGANDVERLKRRIEVFCPNAHVCDPVVLPKTHGHPELVVRADQLLQSSMHGFVETQAPDPEVRAGIHLAKLRNELGLLLGDEFRTLKPKYKELCDAESLVAAEISQVLVGNDEEVAAGLRMRMRLKLLADTHPAWFPYKSMLGLLVLTSGAWDRLLLSLTGSLPSLALLTYQATRNLKGLGSINRLTSKGVSARIQRMAWEKLQDKWRNFQEALSIPAGPASARLDDDKSTPNLVGLEGLFADSAGIFQTTGHKFARSRWWSNFFGLVGTAMFALLAFAPVVAVYSEYFRAWKSRVSWTEFPSPSAGMMFATLLLVLLPVALWSALAVLTSATNARIEHAIKEVKANHERLFNDLMKRNLVRLKSCDPVREAARRLLDFIGVGSRS